MVDNDFTYDVQRNERIVRLARARPQGRLRLSPERRAEIERQLEEARNSRRRCRMAHGHHKATDSIREALGKFQAGQ